MSFQGYPQDGQQQQFYQNQQALDQQSLDQLNNGIQNIALDQQQNPVHSKKKRPARLHHQLSQAHFNTVGEFVAPGKIGSTAASTPSLYNSPSFDQQSYFQQPNYPQHIHQQHPHPQPPHPNSIPHQPKQQQTSLNVSNQGNGGSGPIDSLSVPSVRFENEQEWKNTVYKSFENSVPPTSTTDYISFDQSVSIPKFARLSMYQVPHSEALRNSTKLPLGLTIRPFANPSLGEEPIPEIDLNFLGGPIRCRRCRTYINPFMKFTNDSKFICNMCKFGNDLPSEYFAPLDVNGNRIDYLQRPELHKGTVDFLVPDAYWLEENVKPNPLHIVFLIDVSASDDIILTVTQAIKTSIEKLPSGIKIAIITYDDKLQFYNLSSEVLQIQVVSDLTEPFIPLSNDDLFVDPFEKSYQIDNALNQIGEIYSSYKAPGIAYGAALSYALEALKSIGGGKISAILSKIPSLEPGALVSDIDNKNSGSKIFQSTNEFYKNLSKDFINHQVGLDLFVIAKSSIDLINSSLVVFQTSGILKSYSNFQIEKDEINFTEEFSNSILQTKGYQGQLKVRCSNGLQVSNYYGNFDVLNSSNQSKDPVFPILHSDQEISVLFSYDSKLDVKQDVSFQTALLYTGIDGQRRVRVLNSIAAVTNEVGSVFAFADQDVILNIILKNCLSFLSKQDPIEIKNSTVGKLVEIYSQYKALIVNSNSIPGDLTVPDSLGTLIAFVSSFQKSKIFQSAISNNTKIYEFYQLNSLTLDKLLLKLYPRMISLHDLNENDCLFEDDKFQLPENVKLSNKFIQIGGVYLIFNGIKLVIWIHNRVNPLLLNDLFGVDTLEQVVLDLSLPILDTHISLQVRNLIEYFNNIIGFRLSLNIIRNGIDPLEFEFQELLIEDRSVDKTESYFELITKVHKQINEKISKEQVVKEEDTTLSQKFIHF